MNVAFDFPGHVADQHDLTGLLAPLSADAPCGPGLRHDAVFTEIRLLREEDDPGLPMGQWERPLKRADWPLIERLCSTILTTRSKDLQLASWLAESWTRQRGWAGLADGLRLLDGLLRHYWPALHPSIGEDGDSEARLAPLEWLNRSLGTCVRVHVPLFTVAREKPIPMTLAMWERLTLHEMASGDQAGRGAPDAPAHALNRADIHASLEHSGAALAQTNAALTLSLNSLQSIAAFLHERLHDDSPNLGTLQGALEAGLRVLAQFQAGGQPGQGGHGRGAQDGQETPAGGPGPAGRDDVEAASAPVTTVEIAHWRNRREAYMTLEALADYLSEIEPHSPTPFLIRRAASWGRMSLPEVIAEIIREEGDVGRLFQILGIKS